MLPIARRRCEHIGSAGEVVRDPAEELLGRDLARDAAELSIALLIDQTPHGP